MIFAPTVIGNEFCFASELSKYRKNFGENFLAKILVLIGLYHYDFLSFFASFFNLLK